MGKALIKTGTFLLLIMWFFAGWPPLWRNPRIPPEVQKASAATITVVGSASSPTDGGSQAGPTVAVTPPSGMQQNDVAVLIANYKRAVTLSISQAGGQTWTALTQVQRGSVITSRIFYAVYNGTWSASPSVTIGSGTGPMTVVMHVFRNVNTGTVIDVAQATGSGGAPTSPCDLAITGLTTATNGALVLAAWNSPDNNTWAVQTIGWVNVGGAQYRNGSGNDNSISTAYKILSTIGASGNVTNRQTALGCDQFTTHILAFRATNTAPNAPNQDAPSNGATGVSTTPTFTMTATDPDSDQIGYKVTIYSNSGCSTVVATKDQAADATGWFGQSAACANAPTSCYASGTQGNFMLQPADALAASTQYWWKASAKDPDGTGNFADSSTCKTFTTAEPAVVSVSLSDGIVTYGIVPASTSKDTTPGGLDDTQVATDDGNVVENFNIKGQNSASWTLTTSAGVEQYVHAFCTSGSGSPDPCDASPVWTALTTSYQTLSTSVAVSGTQRFDLRITTPVSTSSFTQQSVDVTVQAVQP